MRRSRIRRWLAIVVLLLGATALLSRFTSEVEHTARLHPMTVGVTLLDAERGTPIPGVRAVALRDGEPATWLECPMGSESDAHGKLVLQNPSTLRARGFRWRLWWIFPVSELGPAHDVRFEHPDYEPWTEPIGRLGRADWPAALYLARYGTWAEVSVTTRRLVRREP